MAVYSQKIHIIGTSDNAPYNIDLVTTLAETTSPLHLNYANGSTTVYTSLIIRSKIDSSLRTPLYVNYGNDYCVPKRNVIPYKTVYYTSSGTFTVPQGITRIRVTLVGGGGGGLPGSSYIISSEDYGGGEGERPSSYTKYAAYSGGSSSCLGFGVRQYCSGGGGAVCEESSSEVYDSSSESYITVSRSSYSNGSGSLSPYALGDGNTYGNAGTGSSARGGNGYVSQFFLSVKEGQTFIITVGGGAGNGKQGAAKVEYGEGI